MPNIHPVSPSSSMMPDHAMLQLTEAGLHQSCQFMTISSRPLASVTQSLPIVGAPHIYVLPTCDRSRIKIGRSIDPLARISHLIRVYPEVDVARAVVVSVDALLVESILHLVFEPYRQELSERRDGYSEWFSGDFGEDVIELCQRIARHRRADCTIFRNLPALLAAHASSPHLAEEPAPSRARRTARPSCSPPCPPDLAVSQARKFVQFLQKRKFDEIVTQNGHSYLARTVRRNDEPDCWKAQFPTLGTDWGRRLMRASWIQASIAGSPVDFKFLNFPEFKQKNSEFGREYFRLLLGPNDYLMPSDADEASALAQAFAIIEEALAPLPQRELPAPPPDPWVGFRKRQRQQAGK